MQVNFLEVGFSNVQKENTTLGSIKSTLIDIPEKYRPEFDWSVDEILLKKNEYLKPILLLFRITRFRFFQFVQSQHTRRHVFEKDPRIHLSGSQVVHGSRSSTCLAPL